MVRRSYLCLLSSAATIGLAIVWTRATRVLGHDEFFYLEYTKQFAESWPSQFGAQWPYGYPFLASFWTEFGLSAYWGMMGLLGLSILVTSFLATSLISPQRHHHWSTVAVFLGLGASPVAFLNLASPRSGWLFAALVMGMIFLVRYWPEPWAIWSSGLIVIIGFSVRYAGIFLLGVMGLYGIWTLYAEQRKKVKLHTTISVLLTGLAIVALLALNVYQTGHMSGKDRPPGGGVAAFPFHAADLGWGFLGGFSSPQVAEFVGGVESTVGHALGWITLGIVFWLCVRAFTRKKFGRTLKPTALVVGSYLICMIIFRAMSGFDPLSSPRFILPVLFPTAALLIAQVQDRLRTVVGMLALGVAIAGGVVGGRGISKEVYGNLETARQVLDKNLTSKDTIVINDVARPLATYYANPFRWRTRWEKQESSTIEETLRRLRGADYGVLAARPEGRFKIRSYQPLIDPYQKLCANADSLSEVRVLAWDETACIVRIMEAKKSLEQ